MTDIVEFFVRGQPKGQPRATPRIVDRTGGKPFVSMSDTREGKHAHFKDALWLKAEPLAPARPWRVPVKYEALLIMQRPQAHWGTGRNQGVLKPSAPPWYACVKPDNDNNEKLVWDTLKTLGFYKDDCYIVDNRTVKIWQREIEDPPGAHIRLKIGLEVGCPTCNGRCEVTDSKLFDRLCPQCMGKGVISG